MPRLLVVSNIPTPYNDALFHHVARQPGLELHVAYCAASERNRSWVLDPDKTYAHSIMRGITFHGSVHCNPAILSIIRRFRPHVCILSGSYTMPTVQIAAVALRSRGIPQLYWGEELQFEEVHPAQRMLRQTLRMVIRHADGVLAIGEKAARSYIRAGVDADKIQNFHYYPDADNFHLAPEVRAFARASIRANLDIPDTATAFLYCGQLIHRKGVDVLLQAHALLQKQATGSILILSGDGPEQSRFRSLAATLGISAVVRFAGFAQPRHLPHYFAAADALVLPSRKEGWGVVVSEGMTAGLPVIASDQVNAALELVEDGVSGFICPVGDANRLMQAMKRVICGGRFQHAAMSAAARRAASREAPQVAAPRLLTLLSPLMSRP